jgi:hypothetical protein
MRAEEWTEPTLFEAHARATDPDTSHEAARSVKVSRHRRWVLTVLDRIGPVDDEALVRFITTQGIPVSGQSARSRRAELVRDGYVERCGTTRLASGRRAHLWRVTPEGHSLARRVGEVPS